MIFFLTAVFINVTYEVPSLAMGFCDFDRVEDFALLWSNSHRKGAMVKNYYLLIVITEIFFVGIVWELSPNFASRTLFGLYFNNIGTSPAPTHFLCAQTGGTYLPL